jgi:hypothetical protein
MRRIRSWTEHVCDIIAQTPNISVNEIHALMPAIERRIVKKAMSKAKKKHQARIDTLRRRHICDKRTRRFDTHGKDTVDPGTQYEIDGRVKS